MYTQNCLLLFLWVNIKTMLVEFLLWWKMLMLWKLYLRFDLKKKRIIFHLEVWWLLYIPFEFYYIYLVSADLSFFIFSNRLTMKSILIQQSNHIVVNNLRISFCITTAKFHIIYITIYIATGNGQNIAARVCYVLQNQILWKFVFILLYEWTIYKIYV